MGPLLVTVPVKVRGARDFHDVRRRRPIMVKTSATKNVGLIMRTLMDRAVQRPPQHVGECSLEHVAGRQPEAQYRR